MIVSFGAAELITFLISVSCTAYKRRLISTGAVKLRKKRSKFQYCLADRIADTATVMPSFRLPYS